MCWWHYIFTNHVSKNHNLISKTTKVGEQGLDSLSRREPCPFYVLPRRFEVAAAVNRLRTAMCLGTITGRRRVGRWGKSDNQTINWTFQVMVNNWFKCFLFNICFDRCFVYECTLYLKDLKGHTWRWSTWGPSCLEVSDVRNSGNALEVHCFCDEQWWDCDCTSQKNLHKWPQIWKLFGLETRLTFAALCTSFVAIVGFEPHSSIIYFLFVT